MHRFQHNAGIGASALRNQRRARPMHDCSSNSFDDWFRAMSIAYLNSLPRRRCRHPGRMPAPWPSYTGSWRRMPLHPSEPTSARSGPAVDRLRRSAGPREHIRHQAIDISRFPLRPERNQRRKRFRKRAQPGRDVTLPGASHRTGIGQAPGTAETPALPPQRQAYPRSAGIARRRRASERSAPRSTAPSNRPATPRRAAARVRQPARRARLPSRDNQDAPACGRDTPRRRRRART